MHITYTFHGEPTVREFSQSEIIIGRPNPYLPPDLDLSSDITVSRTHARLWEEGGHVWIEDLCSKHGTYINEVRLEFPRQLNADDVVRVGETQLLIDVPPKTAHVNAPPSKKSDLHVQAAVNAEEEAMKAVASSKGLQRERLAVLLELPLKLASQKTFEAFQHALLEQTAQLLPASDQVTLFLRNRDNNKLELSGALSPKAAASITGLAERVFNEGRALAWRETPPDGNHRAGLYAPLVWREKVLGVLCADNNHGRSEFHQDDLRLLIAIASYAAMAVAIHRLQDAL
ncbi:MAG: FHA domain-containing protein [Verrucomicrobiota bacterium]